MKLYTCHLFSRLFFLVALTLLTWSVKAQTYSWNKKFGAAGASTSSTMNKSLTTDASGNIFFQLNSTGTIDVDPGPGTTLMNLSTGGVTIEKLDPSGNFLWAKQFPIASSYRIDPVGNLFTAGSFSGTVDVDPGPGIYNLVSNGYNDVGVCKYDNDGNLLWARSVGCEGADQGGRVSVNPDGSVYVGGSFGYIGTTTLSTAADFDPDPINEHILTTAGQYNGFLWKLDASGNFLSVLQLATTGASSFNNMDSDPVGNTYVYCSVPEAYNLGSCVLTPEQGGTLIKIDPSGKCDIITSHLPWEKGSMTVDHEGNIIIGGGFSGTFDFDPGPGVASRTAVSVQDPYAVKFDNAGNFIWVSHIRGNGYANSVNVDADNNVYITGSYLANGQVDFDPGPGTFNLKSISRAMFIQKLNPNGTLNWAIQVNGDAKSSAFGRSVHIDNSGSILSVFEFKGTIDVDPGAAKVNIKAAGTQDVVLHRMTQSALITQVIPAPEHIDNEAKVFPNPSAGYFVVELPQWNSSALFTIYDALGRIVSTESIYLSGIQRKHIDLRGRSAGNYIVEIKSGNKKSIHKIVLTQ